MQLALFAQQNYSQHDGVHWLHVDGQCCSESAQLSQRDERKGERKQCTSRGQNQQQYGVVRAWFHEYRLRSSQQRCQEGKADRACTHFQSSDAEGVSVFDETFVEDAEYRCQESGQYPDGKPG